MNATVAADDRSAQGDKRPADGTRLRILRTTFELIGLDGIGALSNRRIATAAEAVPGVADVGLHRPNQQRAEGVKAVCNQPDTQQWR